MTTTPTPVRPPRGKDPSGTIDQRRPPSRLGGVPGRVRSFVSDLDRRLRRWPRTPARAIRPAWPAWLRLPAWPAWPAWLRLPGRPGGERAVRPGAIDPRIERRRMDVTRRRSRRRLAAVTSLAALGCLVVGGWFLLHSSLMSARVVTVVGASHTPRGEVVTAAGLDGRPPLLDVVPGAAETRIEQLPWVLRATVSRQWPDGVRIAVTERTPVAVVASGTSRWAEVDRSGRVLEIVSTPPTGLPQLAISGTPGVSGSELGQSARPGLAVVASLPPAFVAQVVSVDAKTGDQLRLQLTTPISVLLGGPVQLPAKYSDVASILAHAVLHPGDVIDVTVPGSPVVAGP